MAPNRMDVRTLHFDAVLVDGHADTVSRMLDKGEDLSVRSASGHIDLPRMFEGGLDAQFFAAFVEPKYVAERGCVRRVLDMLDTLKRFCAANPDRIGIARSAADVRRLNAAGRKSCILSIEGGHAIEDDLHVLRMFAELGVRSMTLTWNNSNGWADGCGEEPKNGGLTSFGREVVREMQRIGVLVDISHVHEQTFWAALECARRPVIASHSCAKAICGHRRNLDDEQLRAVARNGGVVCICYYPAFVSEAFRLRTREIHEAQEAELARLGQAGASQEEIAAARERHGALERTIPRPPLLQVLDHIEHAVRVAGPDHVGLGSDFDGVSSLPEGLEDAAALPRITEGLAARGFGEADLRKILGENVLRVMERCIDGL